MNRDAQPKIRIAIAGPHGKMGREAVQAITSDPRFDLVAVLARHAGQASDGLYPTYTDQGHLFMETHPDVWLDFTDADSVVQHIDQCIAFGVRPVIGATGYTEADLTRWNQKCLDNEMGGIAVPNFAIGALLMMRFAAEAAKFFNHAEIVEYHHDGKKDAPSGTAKRTAETMAKERELALADADFSLSVRGRAESPTVGAKLPSRGLMYNEIPIHSVRLPGLVAHQEVIFGGVGEVLTIRHDSLARTSFMPGVLLACSKVQEVRGLVYGLEQLLW